MITFIAGFAFGTISTLLFATLAVINEGNKSERTDR